jgi:hypothetical protein
MWWIVIQTGEIWCSLKNGLFGIVPNNPMCMPLTTPHELEK